MLRKNIVNEAKRVEEDALYSAKGHFYASKFFGSLNLVLGGIAAVISAIAGGTLFAQMRENTILPGILMLIVTVITATLTFIKPNQKETEHLNAGNKYNALKNDARVFYLTKVSILDDAHIVQDLESLNERRNKLNIDSPQIPDWAFNCARKGIENGEADYFVDKN